MSKQTVKLRNGKMVEVETAPPTPPKKGAVKENSLLYARMGTIAVSGVQCEKYVAHSFDGTLATHVVSYRWERSVSQTSSPLCEHHARELFGYLSGSLPPSSNTGVTDLLSREEEPE